MPHHLPLRLDWRGDLVEAAPCLAAVHHLTSDKPRERRVTRRVAEVRRVVTRLRPRMRIPRDNRRQPVRDRLHREDVLAKLQMRLHARRLPRPDVLQLERRRLAVVLEVLAVNRRIVADERLDVLDDFAKRGIGSGADASAEPDTHFGRIATAEHLAVL